jgi:hypothetical protein
MTTITPTRGGWIKRKPARVAKKPKVAPTNSKTLKAIWADPERRKAMIAAQKAGSVAHRAERKANPAKFSRVDIPNGMTRAQAAPLWADARLKADRFIKKMQDKGELPTVVVPGSDEEKGIAALHEATVIALGPGDKQAKLAAIRTVLEYTKAKPASRQKIDITTSEDWLAEIAADDAS